MSHFLNNQAELIGGLTNTNVGKGVPASQDFWNSETIILFVRHACFFPYLKSCSWMAWLLQSIARTRIVLLGWLRDVHMTRE